MAAKLAEDTKANGRPKVVRTPAEAQAFKEHQKRLRRENRARQAQNAARELAAEVRADQMHAELQNQGGKMVMQGGAHRNKENKARAGAAVWAAFEAAGGDEALAMFAKKYPKEFYTQIWAKMIPRVQEHDASQDLEDLLSQLGGGKLPGMTESLPPPIEVEWADVEVTALGDNHE